jgi:hypothetical protein
LSPKTWSCSTSGGICTCRVIAGATGADMSCPFSTTPQQVCCERSGTKPDPNTWDQCYCEEYSAIPAGETCYSLEIAQGLDYGQDVLSCPNGARAPF